MDCLPYDCKTIPLSKTFAYTGVSLLTGLSCNLFEVINLRSDMTVYPNIAKQFPFKDICLYTCHCFQHYLVINFEVIDPYIKKGSSIFAL